MFDASHTYHVSSNNVAQCFTNGSREGNDTNFCHEPETGLGKGPYHKNLEIDNYYQPFNISWSSAVNVEKGGLLGLHSMPLYLD